MATGVQDIVNLEFSKMHGLGNDFVILDGVRHALELSSAQVRHIADRHRGVGCDQLLVVTPATVRADFGYRIYNADGSQAGHCGNGARCLAQFIRHQGLSNKDRVTLDTGSTLVGLRIKADEQVEVNMGEPDFAPANIPFDQPQQRLYTLDVAGQTIQIGALSVGNPHAVLRVDTVASAPLQTLGPLLERHPYFPERCNVGFMEVVSTQAILLRVHERGSGETQACGTGASAAVAWGRISGLLDATVTVDLPGGRLHIQWEGPGHNLYMTGPAVEVFTGTLELSGL